MTTQVFEKAKMTDRAANLFADGYSVECWLLGVFAVYNPTGERYLVDGVNRTCTCKAYSRGIYTNSAGRRTCKHLCGLRALVAGQAAAYEARRTHAPELLANRLDAAAWELYANYSFSVGGELSVPIRFVGRVSA